MTTCDDLVARAKADPEAFRWETVNALFAIYYNEIAWGVAGRGKTRSVEQELRLPWSFYGLSQVPSDALAAHARCKALLQALTEMAPAERAALGW